MFFIFVNCNLKVFPSSFSHLINAFSLNIPRKMFKFSLLLRRFWPCYTCSDLDLSARPRYSVNSTYMMYQKTWKLSNLYNKTRYSCVYIYMLPLDEFFCGHTGAGVIGKKI